jgi:membrane protein YdbS with pleckstrin-like domain
MGLEQRPLTPPGQPAPPAAYVIPPRGRAVLCVWAALPGVLLAPFFFWQGIGWGIFFCALWAGLDFCIWARACSFVASLTPHTLTIQVGITFCTHRTLPRRSITSVVYTSSPLLRLADCGLLLVFAPGCWVALPGLARADALSLHALLPVGTASRGE